jgi:hypothetical protein
MVKEHKKYDDSRATILGLCAQIIDIVVGSKSGDQQVGSETILALD